jgi:hypothetical protein
VNRYHVVILGREAPELLTREGYASKGEARRAWSTAARGAVLLEDGVAIDEKTGTSKVVAAALRRFAAKLKLDDTDAHNDELDEEVVSEVDDEEPDEPPMPPVRASKVRAGRCPSCDEVLPDHLSSCPTLPAVMPEPISKGFEFNDQPEKAFVEVATRVESLADVEKIIARDDVSAAKREAPSRCVAKGCDASTGEIRTTTPREFTCLCPGHRQVARFVIRDHDLDRAGAVEWLRANVRKAHIRAERAQKPPPRVAVSKVKAEAEPLTLTTLRALVESVLRREVELVVRSEGAVLRCVAGTPLATGSSVAELVRGVLPKLTEELDGARGRLRLAEDRLEAARGEVEQVEAIYARLRATGAP